MASRPVAREKKVAEPRAPNTVPDAPARVEVRGEIYFPRAAFAEFNEQRASEGLATFANPRTNPDEAARLRALGRERVRLFHWSSAAERTLEVYRRLAEQV